MHIKEDAFQSVIKSLLCVLKLEICLSYMTFLARSKMVNLKLTDTTLLSYLSRKNEKYKRFITVKEWCSMSFVMICLPPYFTRKAILDNCVCQKGKGMHYALRRFEEKLKKFVHDNGQNGYVLKCDILKYFPSLSHRVLINCIANEIKDERLKSMVVKIIQSFHTRPEFLQRYEIERIEFEGDKTGRGVPIGNQTSQIFGMFYLDKLDRMIKEKFRVKIYSRYMDDFVIVHKDKKFLLTLLDVIKAELDKLDLKLNSRTQIFPLKNGLTYLGFRYQISKTGKLIKKVSNKTAKRFKRRARLIQIAYSEGFIDKAKVMQSLQAYHGHLMHGDCFKLEMKVSSPILKMIK